MSHTINVIEYGHFNTNFIKMIGYSVFFRMSTLFYYRTYSIGILNQFYNEFNKIL